MERMQKHTIVLNSAGRDRSLFPSANSFSLDLDTPFRNVRSVRVRDATFPSMQTHPAGDIYFSELNAETGLWIAWKVCIPSKSYSATTISSQLQASIESAQSLYYADQPPTNAYTVTFNSGTSGLIIQAVGTSGVAWNLHSRESPIAVSTAEKTAANEITVVLSDLDSSPVAEGCPVDLYVASNVIRGFVQSVNGLQITLANRDAADFSSISLGPISLDSRSRMETLFSSKPYHNILGLEPEKDHPLESLSISCISHPTNPSTFSYSAPNATGTFIITHEADNAGIAAGDFILIQGGGWLGGEQIGSDGLRYEVASVVSDCTLELNYNLQDSFLRIGSTLATSVSFDLLGASFSTTTTDLDLSSIAFPGTGNAFTISLNAVPAGVSGITPVAGDVITWGAGAASHFSAMTWEFVSSTDVDVNPVTFTFKVTYSVDDDDALSSATFGRIFDSTTTTDGAPTGGIVKTIQTNVVDMSGRWVGVYVHLRVGSVTVGDICYPGAPDRFLFFLPLTSGNEARTFYQNQDSHAVSTCTNQGLNFERLHVQFFDSSGSELITLENDVLFHLELTHGA